MSVGISYYSNVCPCLPLSDVCRYILLFWCLPLSALVWCLSVCLIILIYPLVCPCLMSVGISFSSDVCPCLSNVCRYILLFWCLPFSALVCLSVYLIILMYALVCPYLMSVGISYLFWCMPLSDALVWMSVGISYYSDVCPCLPLSNVCRYILLFWYMPLSALVWCLSVCLIILMSALCLIFLIYAYFILMCPCPLV